jgi:hypothetical protein
MGAYSAYLILEPQEEFNVKKTYYEYPKNKIFNFFILGQAL